MVLSFPVFGFIGLADTPAAIDVEEYLIALGAKPSLPFARLSAGGAG